MLFGESPANSSQLAGAQAMLTSKMPYGALFQSNLAALSQSRSSLDAGSDGNSAQLSPISNSLKMESPAALINMNFKEENGRLVRLQTQSSFT